MLFRAVLWLRIFEKRSALERLFSVCYTSKVLPFGGSSSFARAA